MKKLLAVLICICMLSTAALAEEALFPGVRLTVDEVAVTIGGEKFEPDLRLVLDEGYDGETGFGSFFVELAGRKLLPVNTQLAEEGLSIQLDDSSVYCIAPALMGVEEIPGVEGGEALSPWGFANDFVEYLDGIEGDSFEIEPLELLAWLEGALHMEQGSLRQLVKYVELPLITAERETLGYSIAVGGENPVNITLRDNEQQVILQCTDVGFVTKVIVGADGNLQASMNLATELPGYSRETIIFTLQYQPKADGSSTYKLALDYSLGYEEPMYVAIGDSMKLRVIGSSDANGVHDVKVTYTDDYVGIDDLAAALHVKIEPVQLQNAIAGEKPVMIESETDSSISSLTFAAMGMLSDVERLVNNETIQGIVSAYEAHSNQFYEVYMQGFEEYADYGITYVNAPEFGWMPEGTQLTGLDVQEYSVQYEFELSGAKLYITVEMPEDGEADESEGQPALSYSSEGNSFAASIVEDGVETTIRSDEIILTEAEVSRILEGRIWIEENLGGQTNAQM